MVDLPTEVWLFVCEELENQREFGALFNCALICKAVAGAAVKSLYQIHSLSPVINEGSDIEITKGGQTAYNMRDQYELEVQAISKWALQWRSIILSSLGQTSYPYCLYIRSLDLRNLAQMFENSIFRDNVQDSFFTDSLSALITSSDSTHATKKFGKQSTRRQNLKYNANQARDVIGESITKYLHMEAQKANAVAALEEISGEIPQNLLLSWCHRLARLKTITLWEGKSLNKDVGEQIKANCPDFNSLTIYSHLGADADSSLAEFLNSLRPNSIRYFEMIHSNDIHQATFNALATHFESLLELKLSSLKTNAIVCLNLLKDCKSLTALAIEDREGSVDLKATENDVFLDIIVWLRGCRNLKTLTIENVKSGADIAIPVLLDADIKLRKFDFRKHLTDELLSALSHHVGLEEVTLRGDASSISNNVFVESICALHNLKILDLVGVSDFFRDKHIVSICRHLCEVRQSFFTGGVSVYIDRRRLFVTFNPNIVSSDRHFEYEQVLLHNKTIPFKVSDLIHHKNLTIPQLIDYLVDRERREVDPMYFAFCHLPKEEIRVEPSYID